ncbi:MAG: hypothetical protein ICV76_02370 [Nitrospiraceae bacterium]|nr:hypothetical protein [Nitrospiraceae bacterium]
MDMVAEEPEDETVREVFQDIKTTLDLPNINSDYRTLALCRRMPRRRGLN